jgi:hypothetical protein
VKVEGLAGEGVGEREVGGVEEVAGELEVGGETGNEVRSAVEGVTDDRMAEGLGVDADLMGAAGFDANFDEGEGAVGSGETFEYVEV